MDNLIDTAKKNKNLKTLVKAAEAAGLTKTLSGEGSYTVFAPNEAAFKGLPPGNLDNLLKDKDRLQKVLKHHVVDGKMTASEIAKAGQVETLQGTRLRAEKDGGVHIGKATAVQGGIECSNGICHVIDTVLMP